MFLVKTLPRDNDHSRLRTNARAVPIRGPLSAYLRGAPTHDTSRLGTEWKFPEGGREFHSLTPRGASPRCVERGKFLADRITFVPSPTPSRSPIGPFPHVCTHDQWLAGWSGRVDSIALPGNTTPSGSSQGSWHSLCVECMVEDSICTGGLS